jgi:hypothetical protein
MKYSMVRNSNMMTQEKQHFETLEAAKTEAQEQARKMGFPSPLRWMATLAPSWIAHVPNKEGTHWIIVEE